MIDIEIGRSASGKRVFPLEFRAAFLRRWDECTERGAKALLMREHGLSKSTVARWLAARERGDWEASLIEAAERGPSRMDSRDRAELARLRAENEALKAKVERSEAAQEILGKAFELLEGINKSSTQTGPSIPPSLMSAEEYARWLKQHKLS